MVPAQPRFLVQQTAAFVVDVVGKPVHSRAQSDHRLQRRGLQCRHLQAVEPAPADAHHPHGPGAPILRCDPPNHLDRIRQFLRGIFILHHAFAVAIAANINAQAGIAVRREIRVCQRIPRAGAVALAVGQVFQDRRNRGRAGILGHPDPRRQPAAIGQHDPHVCDFPNLSRSHSHGLPPLLPVTTLSVCGPHEKPNSLRTIPKILRVA